MAEQHHDLMSLILGSEGFRKEYSHAEYHQQLNDCCSKQLLRGWVFWRAAEERHDDYNQEYCYSSESNGSRASIQDKFKCLLEKLALRNYCSRYLVQIWAPQVVGKRWCLTTLDQPFFLAGSLCKGLCWYRNCCMGHKYFVGVGEKEEDLGPPGRVFRNGHPESSPDLRLYSTAEHPLRDHAASCGGRGYLALPVFDSLVPNHCLGVLEFFSFDVGIEGDDFQMIDQALRGADLRSTHIGFFPPHENPKYKQKLASDELREMLEMTFDAVPQLQLAQLWVPCKYCANMGNSLSCMERATFIVSDEKKTISQDYMKQGFVDPCEFHNVQGKKGVAGIVLSSTNKSCFCRNICDLSICDYPLAHYARQARLSFCFAICLKSVHDWDQPYILEFFLHCPDGREDVLLQLLIQIMDEKLPSFKAASGRQLGEELVMEVICIKNKLPSQSNRYEIIPYVCQKEHQSAKIPMIGYDVKSGLPSDVIKYLENPNLYCPQLPEEHDRGWIFLSRETRLLYKLNNNSIEENIKLVLKKMSSSGVLGGNTSLLVQFWAVKDIEGRYYLSTRDQPFALSSLSKGLHQYRKKCMEYNKYFVDDGAKEEELGPPGRVFRNRLPESSPDIRLYSAREFPLRDNAVVCGFRKYFAMPIFDFHREQCVGILEYIGFKDAMWFNHHNRIRNILEETNLKSTHVNIQPCFLQEANKAKDHLVLGELTKMFQVLTRDSQLHLAQVWVPCGQFVDINNNLSYVEQVLLKKNYMCYGCEWVFWNLQFQKVQIGKGMAGILLESENKSCLFPNLCDFSIIEEPQAHHAQRHRLDVRFAICLQSSYTESNLYILEFFLDRACRECEHLCSFLHFLLLIMKQELKSFKFASGKQVGEELVVEVIKFGENNKFFTSFESHQPVDKFPLRFKIIPYDKQVEHQVVHYTASDGLDSLQNALEAEQTVVSDADLDKGVEVTKDKSKRERNKTSVDISYEVLKQYFGMKQDDVAEKLGVSRSTFKRICRSYSIKRWPSNKRNKKNPSIFETSFANKRVRGTQQQILASSSNPPPPLDLLPGQNVLSSTDIIGSCQHHTELPKGDVVIIKATFRDDIAKIQFCLPSEMEKLTEEVARRFNLKIDSFKLKYLDEDDQWILLACDDDLRLCIKTLTSLGKTPIQVSVQSICNGLF